MIKIIYGTDRTISSLIVRVGTMSRFSHCGIIVDLNNIVHAMPRQGVIVQPVREFENRFTDLVEVEVDIPRPDLAKEFALQQIGKKYDYTAILKLVLQRRWRENDRWFCSELVEAALRAGGRQRFRDEVYRITPQQSWSVI
jgi:uncharacterized protein YycO